MKNDLDAKNVVQFRLMDTPDENLLVSLYHLDVFNEQAVNWHIAGLLVENKLGALRGQPVEHHPLPNSDLQPAGAGELVC